MQFLFIGIQIYQTQFICAFYVALVRTHSARDMRKQHFELYIFRARNEKKTNRKKKAKSGVNKFLIFRVSEQSSAWHCHSEPNCCTGHRCVARSVFTVQAADRNRTQLHWMPWICHTLARKSTISTYYFIILNQRCFTYNFRLRLDVEHTSPSMLDCTVEGAALHICDKVSVHSETGLWQKIGKWHSAWNQIIKCIRFSAVAVAVAKRRWQRQRRRRHWRRRQLLWQWRWHRRRWQRRWRRWRRGNKFIGKMKTSFDLVFCCLDKWPIAIDR